MKNPEFSPGVQAIIKAANEDLSEIAPKNKPIHQGSLHVATEILTTLPDEIGQIVDDSQISVLFDSMDIANLAQVANEVSKNGNVGCSSYFVARDKLEELRKKVVTTPGNP